MVAVGRDLDAPLNFRLRFRPEREMGSQLEGHCSQHWPDSTIRDVTTEHRVALYATSVPDIA
eukprot:2035859-Rhodomonas_salina.2